MISMIILLFILTGCLRVSASTIDVQEYEIWVNGIRVNEENKDDVLSDGSGSVVYEPKDHKLTLKDVHLVSGEPVISHDGQSVETAVYIRDKDIFLELLGDNEIDINGESDAAIKTAIYIDNEEQEDITRLYCKDEATLKINVGSRSADTKEIYAIVCKDYLEYIAADFKIIFSGQAEKTCGIYTHGAHVVKALIDIASVELETNEFCGMDNEAGKFCIAKSELLISHNEKTSDLFCGIRNDADCIFTDATIFIRSSADVPNAYGVKIDGDLSIEEESDISISVNNDEEAYGISCKDLSVSGNAYVSSTSLYGIDCDKISLADKGILIGISRNDYRHKNSIGINTGNIILKDRSMVFATADHADNSFGINAKDLIMKDDSVAVASGKSSAVYLEGVFDDSEHHNGGAYVNSKETSSRRYIYNPDQDQVLFSGRGFISPFKYIYMPVGAGTKYN